MTANKPSSRTVATIPPTTAAVAASPTARGPLPAVRPARQPMRATAAAKIMPLNRPRRKSCGPVEAVIWATMAEAGKPKNMRTEPMPSRPETSMATMRAGMTSMAAAMRGRTSMVGGSMPMVVRAAISSLTCMVPSSAAKAEPVRPARMTATSSGPSSRNSEMATRLAT